MNKKLFVILFSVVSLLLFITGCGKDSVNNSENKDTVVVETNKQTTDVNNNIKLYFADKEGEYLVPYNLVIDSSVDNKYKYAIEQLIKKQENNKDIINIFPPGSKVLAVDIKDSIAYVNMNNDFQKHFPGGSTNELMLIGSIVNTLTSFPDIKNVQILVEGKKIDSLSGHLDLSSPQAKMEDLIKK